MAQPSNKVMGAIAGAAALGSGLLAFWSYNSTVRCRSEALTYHGLLHYVLSTLYVESLSQQVLRQVSDLEDQVAQLKATGHTIQADWQVCLSQQDAQAVFIASTLNGAYLHTPQLLMPFLLLQEQGGADSQVARLQQQNASLQQQNQQQAQQLQNSTADRNQLQVKSFSAAMMFLYSCAHSVGTCPDAALMC